MPIDEMQSIWTEPNVDRGSHGMKIFMIPVLRENGHKFYLSRASCPDVFSTTGGASLAEHKLHLTIQFPLIYIN